MADLSMLELFLSEAQAHTEVLSGGLKDLAGKITPQKMESLIRAATALRGAAKIVGLDTVNSIAEVMLSAFNSMKSSGRADEGQLESIQEAISFISDLSQLDVEEVDDFLEEHASFAAELPWKINSAPVTANISEENEIISSEVDKVEKHVRPAAVDSSMMDLFLSESREHSAIISAALDSLAEEYSDKKIESLIRAAGAIKGASRIVGLSSVSQVAESMDGAFGVIKKSGNISEELRISLKECADFFKNISAVDHENVAEWLEIHSQQVDDLCKGILEAEKRMQDSGNEDASQGNVPVADPLVEVKKAPVQQDGSQPVSKKNRADVSAKKTESKAPELADMSMLDLFRMEAESNSQALSSGLVELEKDQSPERVEPLMRAAHSMKGAARIVGLNDAVGLAHAMEDLLVSCQNGEKVLTSAQIDLLLAATDVYAELAKVDAASIENRLQHLREKMEKLQEGLRAPAEEVENYFESSNAVLSGEFCVGGAEFCEIKDYDNDLNDEADNHDQEEKSELPENTEVYATELNTEGQNNSTANESVVRVSAGSLNRLMALAGESLVESGRLEHFAASLQRIKVNMREVMQLLDSTCERVEKGEPSKDVVAEIKSAGNECRRLLSQHIGEFDLYQRRLDNVSGRLYHEVISSRMRPFSDCGKGFPRLVRDIARQLGKKIDLVIEGENTPVDRDILDRLESPLNHLVRNAVDHGIEYPAERVEAGKSETGVIRMTAGHRAGMLFIEIRDDGRGMEPEKIREKVIERNLAHGRMAAELTRSELMEFLFLPGFSTAGEVTDISGRGVGLDVVHAMVQDVGGTVRAESNPGRGMIFSMQLPLTLSVIRTLLVNISDQPYAIPLSRISRISRINPDEIELSEDRQYIRLDGNNVGLIAAAKILGTGGVPQCEGGFKVIVISDRMNRYGLIVDDFIGEQDLVVRPLDPRFGKIPDVSAVSLMPDGSPVLILDAEDMVRSIDNLLSGGRLGKVSGEKKGEAPVLKILVVDDSLTVREVERKLLVNNGYEVDTAVDGMDGLNAVVSGNYDLVVTDVDMPRMNGIELVRRIKSDDSLKGIPVMMVSYKDREEDRIRGLDAGADYYLTKSSFHDETLLSAVKDLIGGGAR
jgi:two-component system sensor histidine kinase and response regulator WspE